MTLTTEKKLTLARELTTPAGFDAKFFEFMRHKEVKTQEQAFAKTCQLFKIVLNRNPPYTNFNSYRGARNKRIRNNN